ncbi:DUF368 domain-containing protein [Botrimarina sp.]|uniref:DUF368 domain-containing protein n=1 Tax=Botrimarina sp. TaxID=2795802 RepID=UPI0032EB4C9C
MGFRTVAVGVAMGAADIVPGVSGGTVALVLGVYERLLGALARFDSEWLGDLRRGRVAAAWRRVDGPFLITLALGVAIGIKGLAWLMDHLLHHHRSATFAAFFGLIAASGWLVARMASPRGAAQAGRCVALGMLAASLAVWLMSQERMAGSDSLAYTFFSGAVGICAMILPGISGAYLLLMLGKYEQITGIIKGLPAFQSTTDAATLAVFATGCLFGLLAFSRFLKWLLARYWPETMAVLAGFMVGSLYRVWPYQVDTTPAVADFKLKVFEPVWPAVWDAEALARAGIAAGCFVGVLVVDAVARRQERSATVARDLSAGDPTG